MSRMFQGHMVTDEQYAEFEKLLAEGETPDEAEAEVEAASETEEGVAKPRRQRRSNKAAEAAITKATGKVLSVDSEETPA